MSKTTKALSFILIDDNKIDLLYHEKLVIYRGLSGHVTTFSAAPGALEYLNEQCQKPGAKDETVILLLDLQMPVMDGFSFLDHLEKSIQSFLCNIRIFCVTSTLDSGMLNRCESHPLIDAVLRKPLDIEQLMALLSK